MFYIDNDSGVTVMPPVSAQRSAIVRWFSEGDGNNVITWPGMDWFNIVQAELLNTLEEAGIQPDKTKLNQLALSIKAIMSNNALLIKNNLSEIKIAGASAQRTARENLDIYDASLNKKGLVQLTSATDSLSETLAATAKAVKIAMDNANARLAKDRNGADIPNKPLFIQNLGLRELGTSGEKIPLLSTANTWTNRQTFSGGLSGELSGNAATATKLKTARNINGVKFDGSSDININTLVSRNRVTALSGSAKGTPGIQMYEAYNNGYPFAYGNVLHLTGVAAVGEGELFIGWSGTSGGHAPAYIRSRRDTADANWSGWAQLYTTAHKPSAGDIGAYTKAECNSRFITGVRLGGLSSVQTWNGPGWSDKSGYVVTGSVNSNRDELIDTTQARPIQYCINGTWYNVGSI